MDQYLDFKSAPTSRKPYKHVKPNWTNELSNMWKNMRDAEKIFTKCKGTRYVRTNLRNIFVNYRNKFDRELRKADIGRISLITLKTFATMTPSTFGKISKV